MDDVGEQILKARFSSQLLQNCHEMLMVSGEVAQARGSISRVLLWVVFLFWASDLSYGSALNPFMFLVGSQKLNYSTTIGELIAPELLL